MKGMLSSLKPLLIISLLLMSESVLNKPPQEIITKKKSSLFLATMKFKQIYHYQNSCLYDLRCVWGGETLQFYVHLF
jgi:hypothetical protein